MNELPQSKFATAAGLAAFEDQRGRPLDVERSVVTSNGWRAIFASTIGPSHLAGGVCRQDACDVRIVGGVILAVMADGLSSAHRSDKAAGYAANCMAKALEQAVTGHEEPIVWTIVAETVRAVATELAEVFSSLSEGRPEHDGYLTTLLGVVADASGGLMFNIGDGAVLAFSSATQLDFRSYKILRPAHGEYSGQVFPLLAEYVDEQFRIQTISPCDRLLVMTDGVAEFALNSAESGPSEDFITAFDAAMRNSDPATIADELARYLSSERAMAVNGDDKTIVWAEGVNLGAV